LQNDAENTDINRIWDGKRPCAERSQRSKYAYPIEKARVLFRPDNENPERLFNVSGFRVFVF